MPRWGGLILPGALIVGLLSSVSAVAAPAGIQREPVRWHMQSGNPHGSLVGAGATATLVRTSRGLSFSIRTNQLRSGHAYTMWVVVINDPAACSANPCSPQDILLTPETDAQITYGTGHVVGSMGRAGFAGSLRRGPIPEGWLTDQGLDDPLAAQVHLILNDHGPKLPEFMPEMIQTYRAGCTDESLPPIFPETATGDGTPGPNTCRLFQLAVFQ
jgi:hypothetical protein